jgi:hypothetical protein
MPEPMSAGARVAHGLPPVPRNGDRSDEERVRRLYGTSAGRRSPLANAAPSEGDAYNKAVLTSAQRHDLRTVNDSLDQLRAAINKTQRTLAAIVSIEGREATDDELFHVAGELFGLADSAIIQARSVRTVASEVTLGKTLED